MILLLILDQFSALEKSRPAQVLITTIIVFASLKIKEKRFACDSDVLQLCCYWFDVTVVAMCCMPAQIKETDMLKTVLLPHWSFH